MEEQVSSAIFLGLDLAQLVAVIGSPILFVIAIWLGVSAGEEDKQRER